MIRLAFIAFIVLQPAQAFAGAWDVSERQYMLECAIKVDGVPVYRSDRYFYRDTDAWVFSAAPDEIQNACELVRPDPNVDTLRIIDKAN